jgi:hypothetical protein
MSKVKQCSNNNYNNNNKDRPKQSTDLIMSQVKLLPIQYLLLIKYKLLRNDYNDTNQLIH